MAAMAPAAQYTRPLAEFALSIDPDRVPDHIQHEAQRILLDCIGVAVAGLLTPSGQIAVDLVKGQRGPLQATVIGAGEASLMPAAFANTVLTNAIDFEVYGPEGHVCAVAAPVAMAMAEAVDASGSELLAGLVAGLEIGGRVGGALRRPGMEGARSLGAVRGHAHVIFAAVAAAGRLLRLTPDQMHHAFGIAGYSANVPTLRKFFASSDPPMTKYDHLGAMAQNGIQAALLAQRGFTGDLEVLEGDIGFWRFGGAQGCDWDHLTRDLGTYWTIPEVSYKLYPVGLYGIPGIHLVRQMVGEHGLRPEEIEHIEVRTTRAGEGAPLKEVRHALDAWLNARYTMAAGVFDVRPLRSWQEPQTYQRADLLDFMSRIDFRPVRAGEVKSTGNYWERWSPARATIRARGRTFEGSSEDIPQPDEQQIIAKYRENVQGLLTDAVAGQVERACWNLAQLKSARELAYLVRAQDTAG